MNNRIEKSMGTYVDVELLEERRAVLRVDADEREANAHGYIEDKAHATLVGITIVGKATADFVMPKKVTGFDVLSFPKRKPGCRGQVYPPTMAGRTFGKEEYKEVLDASLNEVMIWLSSTGEQHG